MHSVVILVCQIEVGFPAPLCLCLKDLCLISLPPSRCHCTGFAPCSLCRGKPSCSPRLPLSTCPWSFPVLFPSRGAQPPSSVTLLSPLTVYKLFSSANKQTVVSSEAKLPFDFQTLLFSVTLNSKGIFYSHVLTLLYPVTL